MLGLKLNHVSKRGHLWHQRVITQLFYVDWEDNNFCFWYQYRYDTLEVMRVLTIFGVNEQTQ